MKIKEFKNFKDKPLPELRKELQAREEKLSRLRFDLSAGKVKNIREIRHIKKDIAQIMTLIKLSNHA
jgi:ribosomal protein L29